MAAEKKITFLQIGLREQVPISLYIMQVYVFKKYIGPNQIYIYDVDFKYNMLHSDCKFNNAFSKAISQIPCIYIHRDRV